MDGRRNNARTFLFLSPTRHPRLSDNHGRLQSALSRVYLPVSTLSARFRFPGQLELRINQDERHGCLWIDIFSVQLHCARPILDLRDVEDGELKRFADLLRG